MPPASRFARARLALLAVSAAAFGACQGADRITNTSDDVTESAEPLAGGGASFLNASTGGVPFGFYHMPNEMYSSTFTGSLRGMAPTTMLKDLEAARKAGGNVIVSFVGNEKFYKNDDGTFSLAKWKARLDPFRNLNFTSYITDGTIVGHYLIDEPHDWGNWNNTQVSPATLEEMARYSKQLWPAMPTIVRTFSWYLKGRTYQYLDAAWAQYALRFGAVKPWLDINVRDAKAAGLGLVIGMNIIAGSNSATGGLPGYYSTGYYAMNAAQVVSVSSALLDDPYPCAFISWKYHEAYLARSDIKAALATVGTKARARSFRSCRGAASGTAPPPPPSNQPPTAAFAAPNCTVGVACQFNDGSGDSDGTIASRSWSFGDAGTSTAKDPTHTYATAKVYSVTLTVTDDDGAVRSVSHNVTVTLPGAPPPPPPPSTIVLSVSGWTDATKQYMRLDWTGANGTTVAVYRDGPFLTNQENDGVYTNTRPLPGSATYTYKVCEAGTTVCSNEATVQFGEGAPPPPPPPPPNSSPTAAFTAPACTAGLPCQFTDESGDTDGTIATRGWSFGDGTSSSQPSPTHTYAAAGPYSVTLAVTDDDDATNSVSHDVTVSPPAPLPSPPPPPSPIVLSTRGWEDATKQHMRLDWSGASGTTVAVYRNGPFLTNQANDGMYTNSRTFQGPATYTYKVCEVGTTICSNESTVEFGGGASPPPPPTPPNSSPTAAFTAPACTAGLPCQFTDESGDTDGTIATRSWSFGDGTSSSQPSPTHTYAAAGPYSVTLAVTDDDDATNSVSHDVTVSPPAPLPSPPPPPSPIVLSTRGWEDATKQHMRLDWSGASGTTVAVYRNGPFLTNQANDGMYTNSRTFQGPATYTYKVCEVGTTICSNESTVEFGGGVSVASAPPSNTPPTAAFTVPSCTAGVPCQFTDESGDTDGTIATHSWSFGEGASSSEPSPTHTYAAAGPYSITLTVTDDDGATSSVSHDVAVVPGAPPIALSVSGFVRDNKQNMALTWSGAAGPTVEVYRDNGLLTSTLNDGKYTNSRNYQNPITYIYKVCEAGTSACSSPVSVSFQ